jgi:hypothetical protein
MVVFPFFRRLSLLIIAICSSNGVDQPKFSDLSAHPRTTINTNVGVAQGIAPIDFGFIGPAVRGAIAKTATHGRHRGTTRRSPLHGSACLGGRINNSAGPDRLQVARRSEQTDKHI